MKKLVVIFFLLVPALTWAADREALYTHCVHDWSAEAVGEVLLARAVDQGYPATAPDGERSGTKAYQLGQQYFVWLDPQRNISSAVTCALLVERGPMALDGW